MMFRIGDIVRAISNNYVYTTKATAWVGKVVATREFSFDATTISSTNSGCKHRTFTRLHNEDFELVCDAVQFEINDKELDDLL